ncbi:unnamed protein product [Phytomonas sp. EM1]|nr:unnamed protein product [Phytomonas sp. EM1]|eukprot:CCW65788.1 unnamed protein product [Phytomonas sp. isolate EM1]
MFSCSRVGRTVRLVSLTLVESPATGTASLNLHLSRSNPALAYGFKLKADRTRIDEEATPASTTAAPRRYRLVEIPSFVHAASRTVAALFPNSRVSEEGAVYLSAVNGYTVADAKGMMRALVEGKDHAVQLTVEGMPVLPQARGKKAAKGPTDDAETVVSETESGRKAEGKPVKKGRRKITKAKTKLKERKPRQKAPSEVAKDTTKANPTTSDAIGDSNTNMTSELLGKRSSDATASAASDGGRSTPQTPKGRRGRPSKRESAEKKGETEENSPAEVPPTTAVDSHEASLEAEAIDGTADGGAGNPLLDSTAAIIQLTQRLSTLAPPPETAGEGPTKGKARGKAKATDLPTEEGTAWFGNLASKGGEGKAREKPPKRPADGSKPAKARQASSGAWNDGEGEGNATANRSHVRRRGTKGDAPTSDEEGPDSSESFTMEL